MLNPEANAARVARLRALMAERGYDAALIRNNADLRWLTGAERTFDFELAHTALVTADALFLHTDSRYYNTFRERLGEDCPWQIDEERVDAAEWAARHIAAARARVVAVEDSLSLGFFDDLTAALNKQGAAALMPRLHDDIARRLRAVKDEAELELLQAAQDVTDAAFEHICGFIRPGQTEKEIRAELEGWMLSHGADALSFDSIIAGGPNGANPHAQPSDRPVREGDLIVMDYGAAVGDYHADMTRTVALGEPSARQREVYAVVQRAHEESAALARAGVIGKDVHQHSVDVITEAGFGDYYGHGLGHGVGLQIHEQPCFNPRFTDPIPSGAVVTVEPGIYLPGEFGIRLEDCGVVREDGYHPFTKSPHALRVIPV